MPNKTKKYQLLLHIGLPKTASTTLQHNVFFQLDQAGKINFLSRKSANNILYSSKNIDDLKLETNKLLTTNKLNVLSNENFSHSVNYNSADVFCKLKTIFDDCEIKLLVSLRSPMDFIFSYYVEQYCCNFYADKQNNSFTKFANNFLTNAADKKYLTFNYADFLALTDKYFSHKTIVLFEDLKTDRANYFATLANLLKIDKDEIEQIFFSKKHNTKAKTAAGKQSNAVTLHRYISARAHFFIPSYLIKIRFLKYPWKLFLKLTKYINLKNPKEHIYPDEQLSAKLSHALSIKNVDKFAQQHNLDKDKLIEYNYAKAK